MAQPTPTGRDGRRPSTSRGPRSRYAELPPPVRLEDLVTSSEASSLPPEKDDYWREVEWMLRVSGVA